LGQDRLPGTAAGGNVCNERLIRPYMSGSLGGQGKMSWTPVCIFGRANDDDDHDESVLQRPTYSKGFWTGRGDDSPAGRPLRTGLGLQLPPGGLPSAGLSEANRTRLLQLTRPDRMR
jgi:hypothetical protein